MEQIFNKLVRDGIPKKIESNGEVAVIRILEDEEYREELYKKLLEEVKEVLSSESSDSILEELADVLEVIIAIAEIEGKSLDDIVDIADQKRLKRGGFKKKIFLEKTFKKD